MNKGETSQIVWECRNKVPAVTFECDDSNVATVTKGGQAATLTGATAFGEFERPVDGAKIRCAGTVSGGTITIKKLTAAQHAVQ